MPAIPQLKEQLKRAAIELGFDLAGVAGVADTPEHRFFPDWIGDGRAGEMKYLEARNEADELKRASLANAVPWACSVVLCAINYNVDEPYSLHAGSPTQGAISRYAWSKRDYHDVVLEKLRALEAKLMGMCGDPAPRTWCYVDTGPVIERIFAKYAGVGWIGKNTCILNEKLGRGSSSACCSPRWSCRPTCPQPTTAARARAASMPARPTLSPLHIRWTRPGASRT